MYYNFIWSQVLTGINLRTWRHQWISKQFWPRIKACTGAVGFYAVCLRLETVPNYHRFELNYCIIYGDRYYVRSVLQQLPHFYQKLFTENLNYSERPFTWNDYVIDSQKKYHSSYNVLNKYRIFPLEMEFFIKCIRPVPSYKTP